MATLGERLKAQNEDRIEQARRKAEAEDRAKRAKVLENEQTVRAFGERLKQHIIRCIEAGDPIKGLQVPKGEPFNTYGWKDNTTLLKGHPYAYVFAEVVEWARQEGLTITLTYGWDGGGRDSWYTAGAEPA